MIFLSILVTFSFDYTVEAVLSGHPQGEWLSDCLIQGDRPMQVARNTVQRIWSPVLIKSDICPQIETFISSILMICENKQENQLLLYHILKLYEQVVDTVWSFNTGQDSRKRPIGTSQMVTA